jgi:L-threonylcarbamoyladenylate synthase
LQFYSAGKGPFFWVKSCYFAAEMIIKDIALAKNILEQGELVAIPTETVYGLAANAFDAAAIAKIYQVKNRPQFNPLIIHSNSLERFSDWGIHLP